MVSPRGQLLADINIMDAGIVSKMRVILDMNLHPAKKVVPVNGSTMTAGELYSFLRCDTIDISPKTPKIESEF